MDEHVAAAVEESAAEGDTALGRHVEGPVDSRPTATWKKQLGEKKTSATWQR